MPLPMSNYYEERPTSSINITYTDVRLICEQRIVL